MPGSLTPDLPPSCEWKIYAPDGLGVYGIIFYQNNTFLEITTNPGLLLVPPDLQEPIHIVSQTGYMNIQQVPFIRSHQEFAPGEFAVELTATSKTGIVVLPHQYLQI